MPPPVFHEHLLSRTTTPAALLTLAQAKAWCRIDHDSEDDTITDLIAVATDTLDGPSGMCGHALTNQRWRMSTIGQTADGLVWLPVSPAVSIFQIQYYDTTNTLQTATTSHFRLLVGDNWAYVEPADGYDWPALYDRIDALQIEWTAGYGDADDVPAAIRQAAKMLVAHWYANREAVVTGTIAGDLPMAVRELVSLRKQGWIGA